MDKDVLKNLQTKFAEKQARHKFVDEVAATADIVLPSHPTHSSSWQT